MPNYRRPRIKGATVFITLVTYQRVPFLIQPEARQILRSAWNYVSIKHPLTIDAICLLPDHIHAIITLPEEDDDYSIRIREIKRMFTIKFMTACRERLKPNDSWKNKGEATLWQRRFWDHIIRDEKDFQSHFDYIHYNPVKHGLVDSPSSWEWSSFHRYVRLGVYEDVWGKIYGHKTISGDFGE